MIINQLKTTILLASMAGIFMFVGWLIAGAHGILTAFVIAILFNGFAYFYSDKLVLNMFRAVPLDQEQYGWLYQMVSDLAEEARLPMPKIWLIKQRMANAFATGRNPQKSSIAVTTGILDLLDRQELRAVLAHELSHVHNRDILVSTMAATLASAIGFIANMAYHMAYYQTLSGDRQRRGGVFFMLLVSAIMPLAATLIRLAISRSREYLADESGAHLSKEPLALASALRKIHDHIAYAHLNKTPNNATTAHLFIMHPFTQNGFTALFSTHPPVAKRIARLEKMAQKMHSD